MDSTQTKRCTRCGKGKAVSEFPKDRRRDDGLFPWCKPCKAGDQRERNHRNDPGIEARRAAREAQAAGLAEAARVAVCECGCGENPGVYAHSERGHERGEPRRWVPGHESRGRTLSPETRAKITGRPPESDAKASAVHRWLVVHHPKAGTCEECGREGKTDYAFQRHPEPYTRDREDYRELCRSCHFRLDEPTIGRGSRLARSGTTEQRRAAGKKGAEARWGSRGGE